MRIVAFGMAMLGLGCSQTKPPPPIVPAGARAPTLQDEAGPNVNRFALSVFSNWCRDHPKADFVFAPSSLSTSFSLLAAGAAVITEDELRGVASLPTEETTEVQFRYLTESLKRNPPKTYRVANALWIDEGFSEYDKFPARRRKHEIDVQRGAWAKIGADATRRKINEWADQGFDVPRELIGPNGIAEGHGMISTSRTSLVAVAGPEIGATKCEAEFSVGGNVKRRRPFLSVAPPSLRTATTERVDVFAFPLPGSVFECVFVRPKAGTDLSAVEAGLDERTWSAWVAGLAERGEQRISFPSLKAAGDARLTPTLAKLGLDQSLRREAANFTGITSEFEGLCLSEVYQRVRLVLVPAEGLRDATDRGVVFDGPFLFAIRDPNSGALIILGREWGSAGTATPSH